MANLVERFAPKDLCEKLQKMGCVSESGFYWTRFGIIHEKDLGDAPERRHAYAFDQNDFTGSTWRARQNSEIAWTEEPTNYIETVGFDCRLYNWEFRRVEMIFISPREEYWWHYLQRTMREAA